MLIVLFSLLLSFAITGTAYWFLQKRSADTEAACVRRRLGVETEQERMAAAVEASPALIRASVRGESRWLLRIAPRLHFQQRLRALIEHAGASTTVERVQQQALITGLIAAAVILIAAPGLFRLLALPAGLLAALFPIQCLRRAARKRLARFEAQFPSALEFISRSMRAGHAFSVSLEMLHQEFEPPLAHEFRRVFEEQNLGMPVDAALARLASRIQLIDVSFFVSAVVLQRKTGGNLTEILDTLAEVIRERYKLKGKVRAIAAHGRITAKALSAIPIVVGIMMFLVNREYATFFLHTATGLEMLGASLAMQIIAYIVIDKIVTIEV
jgi:tight adherence protein B